MAHLKEPLTDRLARSIGSFMKIKKEGRSDE